MSNYIYQPKGRAAEYSPLAFNLFTGCMHGCVYCYNQKRFPNNELIMRNIDLVKLEDELIKNKYDKYVMLSFVGDIFCVMSKYEMQKVEEVLKLLCDYDVPISILTKGGMRANRFMDILSNFSNIKIGATLTFDNDIDSLKYEPGAATYSDRKEMLKAYHDAGFKTFVSLEPIFDVGMANKIIEETHEYVDYYMAGKMNHYDFDFVKLKSDEQWKFASLAIFDNLLDYSKEIYVKKSIQKYLKDQISDFQKSIYFKNNLFELKGK